MPIRLRFPRYPKDHDSLEVSDPHTINVGLWWTSWLIYCFYILFVFTARQPSICHCIWAPVAFVPTAWTLGMNVMIYCVCGVGIRVILCVCIAESIVSDLSAFNLIIKTLKLPPGMLTNSGCKTVSCTVYNINVTFWYSLLYNKLCRVTVLLVYSSKTQTL